MEIDNPEPYGADILRRPTPLTAWQAIVDEIPDTLTTDEQFGPIGNFQQGANQFDYDAEYDGAICKIDQLREEVVFRPRFPYRIAANQEECACPSTPPEANQGHRVGNRGNPILPMSFPTNPSLENSAILRRRRSLDQYGYHPYVKWGTLADIADSTYEPEVAGNAKLPHWRSFWSNLWVRGSDCWTWVCGPKANLGSSECETCRSGTDDYEIIRKEYYMGRRPSQCEDESQYRCGVNTQSGAPLIAQPMYLGVQESLDAVTNNALVNETVQFLMSALAKSTQNTYLETGKCGHVSVPREGYRRGWIRRSATGMPRF